MLLVVFDTTRADHCSAFGYERNTTPNMKRLAEQGAGFSLAYAPTATTGPTHATLFTSLYPIAHRVIKNGLSLANDFDTVAELLSDCGYQTGAIVSAFVLDSKFGFAQGFDFYDDELAESESTSAADSWESHDVHGPFDRRADFSTDRAMRWLEKRNPQKPFFLFVHYYDPHYPYTPPDEFARQFPPADTAGTSTEVTIARYDAEIAFTDNQFGRLLSKLAELELDDDTIVVVTSDHGEGLMQRGHIEHGVHIYEEAVHVPLVISWPGRIAPRPFYPDPVELIDLPPTLFEMIKIDTTNLQFQGHSIAQTLLGNTALAPDHTVFLHRRHYEGGHVSKIYVKGEKFAVRVGRWKYIVGPEEGTKELFDLVNDPGELKNLVDEMPEKTKVLAARLDQLKVVHASGSQILDERTLETLNRMKTLGYGQ